MDWRMVVGLGNPGRRYERTPHNAGFLALDRIAERGGAEWRSGWRFPARVAEWRRELVRLVLVKPTTYMNASGNAVAPLLRMRGGTPDRVIVVLDDADLPPGALRIRSAGSAGGHRGLRSVLDRLGTEAVPRIRIGIGRQPGAGLVEHVLSPFGREEWAAVRRAVDLAAEAVVVASEEGVEQAMNRFNRTATDGRKD